MNKLPDIVSVFLDRVSSHIPAQERPVIEADLRREFGGVDAYVRRIADQDRGAAVKEARRLGVHRSTVYRRRHRDLCR